MYELPDEIWDLIKEFQIDYKEHHKIKIKPLLKYFNFRSFGPEYERWTMWPPWSNTNDIIIAEYLDRPDWAPRPNLQLTTITWNVTGTGGWWCGYGWIRRGQGGRSFLN